MKDQLKAPFPWFGGKSRAVEQVWSALGDVKNYVEPFCGSAAILLGRPAPIGVETINDADGYVANFWRAVSEDPNAVAHHADWPVNECDLEARHAWLVARSDRLRWSLEDPDFYDAKIAGWWLWGLCAWIGTGWCSGKGPHKHDGAHFSGDGGRGINRQIPHVGNGGQGINRQIPHVGNGGRGEFIASWIAELSARLRDVRVVCGDWRRVLTDTVTVRHGETGVFLDPPYCEGKMDYSAGGNTGNIAQDAWSWAVENGDRMRIVVAAYEDGRSVPDGWTKRTWTARKGYATDGAKSKTETLYCSPRCASAQALNLLGAAE